MTQLTALNARMTGDNTGFKAAIDGGTQSVERMAGATTRAQGGVSKMSGSLTRLGNMSSATRFKVQQFGFQVQDVAVQLAAGTRATTVFAQQGSQILGIFGPVGSILGAVAAVTLPLLGAAFLSASDKASSLEDAIKGIGEEAQTAKDKLDLMMSGLSSVKELRAQEELNALLAKQNALHEQANATLGEGGDIYLARAQKLQPEIDILRAELKLLRDSNRAVEVIEKTQARLNDLLRQAVQIDLASVWQHAEGPAARLLNIAQRYTAAISNGMKSFERGQQVGRGRGLGPQGPTTADLAKHNPGVAFSLAHGGLSNLGGGTKRGGGGGGGGGGAGNPVLSSLESLRESLMTQEEAQIASFARQQETLQQALQQRLLTQQEYAGLMEQAQTQHSDRMAQIDVHRYGTGLQKAGAFMGDMANAFSAGNEKTFKIAQKFGAAQALVNAFTGATEALKMPFPANLAAYANVLATGMGAVSAIQGARPGGSTSGSAAATAAAPQVVRNVSVSILGDHVPKDQFEDFFEKMNEMFEGGARFNLA